MTEANKTKASGGVAPFGYRWRNGRLVIDESEAPTRRLIYELFLKHRRKQTVAKLLNELGYRTRNKALFSDTTIDRLLRDSTAKGVRIEYGNKIAVDAIVDAETWDRVNRLLGTKIGKQPVHLFAGIVGCSCGGRMIVPGNSSKYVCTKCRHKIPTDDLEHLFHSQLRPFIVSEAYNLFESWPHLKPKDKIAIVENVCEKITVARESIAVRFACDLSLPKMMPLGQRAEVVNETTEYPHKKGRESHPENEPLLSEEEAAQFLGVSKMTLFRARNAGNIRFFRVGSRVLYSREKHLIPYLYGRENNP
jgi:excisionase family DNA binding protein